MRMGVEGHDNGGGLVGMGLGALLAIRYHRCLSWGCMVEVGEFWLLEWIFFETLTCGGSILVVCQTWLLSRDSFILLVYMVVDEAKDWGFGE